MGSFGSLFSALPDPRASNAWHNLSEVLFIAFAAVLCGAENCQDMADFGVSKERALRRMLRLRHGIPSHDTFSRLFRLLDPVAFEMAFRQFTAAFAAQIGATGQGSERIVAIDGKSIAGAFEAGARASPLHLVTAWGCQNRLVLAQRRAPGRSETRGALELVGLLDLENTTVTADALHGNRKMAAAICARGGHYALALKGNRGPLYHAAVALLADAPSQACGAPERAHGRCEERRATVAQVPPDWAQRYAFAGLAAIARIDTVRVKDGDTQLQSRYFVLSRLLPTARALEIVRAHWGIENRQHWILDVAFDEDRARARKDNAGENLALLRRLALNLLHTDGYKAAIRRKIKRAGWDDDYFFALIAQMR